MALLGYDGFEGIETVDAALRGWTLTAGGVGAVTSFTTGGLNGRRVLLESGGVNGFAQSSARVVIVAVNEAVIGAAVRVETSNSSTNCGIFQFEESGTIHLTLSITDAGQFRVYRGNTDGTLLASSDTGLVSEGNWYYVEFRGLIDNSAGEVEVWLEGEQILSTAALDTRNGGTSGVADRLLLVASTAAGLSQRGVVSFDDVYWLDTAGSAPYNAALGPVRVDRLVPTSDGASSDFTPSTGSDNFAMVDEDLPDGDTTYNESSTVSHKDIFGLSDLATPSGTIFAVQTRVRARRTDAGAVDLIPSIISDATEDDGATRALGSSYSEFSDIFTADPDGSVAWSDAAVNALQAAYRIS
jgi:hypothetical protein